MADGYFPTLISKDKDPNLVTNPVFVELSDGTAALGTTGGALDVNLTNTSVAVTGTFYQTTQPVSIASTVNVDIQDSWAGLTGGGTEAGALRVTIASDSTGVLSIDDNGAAITVDASDLDIRNLNLTDDAVKISANTTANSASNPIYVSFTTGAITGEVHNYLNSTTVNHDYTVSATMLLKQVSFACSGGGKVELQVGPLATLATKWVGFVPKHGGEVKIEFDPPIEVPNTSTGTVRLIRTNRESSAQDLYSTIIGIDA